MGSLELEIYYFRVFLWSICFYFRCIHCMERVVF